VILWWSAPLLSRSPGASSFGSNLSGSQSCWRELRRDGTLKRPADGHRWTREALLLQKTICPTDWNWMQPDVGLSVRLGEPHTGRKEWSPIKWALSRALPARHKDLAAPFPTVSLTSVSTSTLTLNPSTSISSHSVQSRIFECLTMYEPSDHSEPSWLKGQSALEPTQNSRANLNIDISPMDTKTSPKTSSWCNLWKTCVLFNIRLDFRG